MPLIDIKLATLYIRDGDTPTNEIEVKIGEGNFNYTETVNRDYILDRGRLDFVRNGDEVPLDVSFDFVWEYITGGGNTGDAPSIEDALKRRGNASAWVSTTEDQCQPYSVDLVLLYTPDCNTGDQELLVFPDFRYNTLAHDLRNSSVACAGQCNVTEATITRHLSSSSVTI
jgi:hypothetical protein